jgi:hypothetical protein
VILLWAWPNFDLKDIRKKTWALVNTGAQKQAADLFNYLRPIWSNTLAANKKKKGLI